MSQRWWIIAGLAGVVGLAVLLVPRGPLSRPEGHTPRNGPAPPHETSPAIVPPADEHPVEPHAIPPPAPRDVDAALPLDLVTLFHALLDPDHKGMRPDEWAQLSHSIRDRAWADLDTFLLLLRELSSTYGSNADFLSYFARLMDPGNVKSHMSILGRVAELLPFLDASAPPGIRAIAGQALVAHARDVAGSMSVTRMEAQDLELVARLLDSSRDEALVERLARAFAVYADSSGAINDWFLRSFAAAGPAGSDRLRLLDSYVVHAKLSGPVLTTIVHALEVLKVSERSRLLQMLAFRGLDPESRSTILPAAERIASSDPDPSCRGNAMAILLREDDPDLFERAVRLLTQEPDANARKQGVSQLAWDEFYGGHVTTGPSRFTTAIGFLGDPSPAVGAEALRAGCLSIKRDLVISQDNAKALANGRTLLEAIKSQSHDRAVQLKELAVQRLARDWPEALDDPQLKAELDSIR